jgi:excisionase family DNA binding protein
MIRELSEDSRMPKNGAFQTDQKPFQLYTIKETARQLASSEKTVRRLIERGALRSHNVGRSIRIDHRDLAAYLAGNASHFVPR